MARKCHPEEESSILGFFSVSWVLPLLQLAAKRPILEEDVWDCPKKQSVGYAAGKFWSSWTIEESNAKALERKPSLLTALLKAYGREIAISGLCQMSFALTQLAQPYLVGEIVNYMATGNGGLNYGVGLTFGFASISITSSALLHLTLFRNRRLGASVRSAVMASVYSYSLNLSSSAQAQAGTGTLTTLMAIDSEKMFIAAQFIHFLWHGPFAALVVLLLLIRELGIRPCSAGLGWVLMMIFMQNKISDLIAKIRQRMVSLTSERIKLTSELLSAIRAIKVYGWEQPLGERILQERSKEMTQLHRYLTCSSYLRELLFIGGPFLTLVLYTTYIYADLRPFSVAQVFRVLAFGNTLRFPLNLLGQALKNFSDAKISISRLELFFGFKTLSLSNMVEDGLSGTESSQNPYDPFIEISSANFCWGDEYDDENGQFALRDINFATANAPSSATSCSKVGELIAVVGEVGSGKSTFFASILSETARSGGYCHVKGTVAYCSQTPWIQNLTLRDNVLFGEKLIDDAYQKAIWASNLLPDISALPSGDQTEIGERGINLSGGQKARVALARAFYAALTGSASIILLDDPFSSVDASTAQFIFHNGFLELVRQPGKIIIVSLNSHTNLVHRFDRVLVLNQGNITDCGTLDGASWASHGTLLQRAGIVAVSSGDSLLPPPPMQHLTLNSTSTTTTTTTTRLIKEETRKAGQVALSTYLDYFGESFSTVPSLDQLYQDDFTKEHSQLAKTRCLGTAVVVVLLVIYAASQVSRVSIDFCLANWAETGDSTWGKYYYISFGICLLACLARSYWLNFFSVLSSEKIHRIVFTRLLQAHIPLFFDVRSVGEILNKFSKDAEVMDSSIPEFLMQGLMNSAQVVSIFALSIWANPYFAVILIPLFFLFLKLFKYFSAASRDLKRWESISRSPIYSSLSETLTGLDTIRAYGAQNKFLARHGAKMERNTKYFFHLWCVCSWMTCRLELTTSLVLFSITILCVSLREASSAISLGMALSYGLQLTALFQRCIQLAIDVSTYFTSVERILEFRDVTIEKNVWGEEEMKTSDSGISSCQDDNRYLKIATDDVLLGDGKVSGNEWIPSHGVIEFRDVHMAYRPSYPTILKGVSFETKGGEMIGICGRTGSGKSSIVQSLFRIVELTSGSIKIDGVDTRKIPIQHLRRMISIIPQDPTLMLGSLRFQLDPFHEFSDLQLQEVLGSVALGDFVKSLPGGLDYKVEDGGSNLSVGQRQLVCISRAILRTKKILVIDEGTSSVDSHTDDVIQRVLRTLAKKTGCTVLCIAHRLSTIADFDRILCLDDGRVANFGTPQELLAVTPTSLFTTMLRAHG